LLNISADFLDYLSSHFADSSNILIAHSLPFSSLSLSPLPSLFSSLSSIETTSLSFLSPTSSSLSLPPSLSGVYLLNGTFKSYDFKSNPRVKEVCQNMSNLLKEMQIGQLCLAKLCSGIEQRADQRFHLIEVADSNEAKRRKEMERKAEVRR
jgi:hypothetical protein